MAVRSATPQQVPGPPTLLTLPQELRDIIYAYVYTRLTVARGGDRPRSYRMLPPCLSAVCQQIRSEVYGRFTQERTELALAFWTSERRGNTDCTWSHHTPECSDCSQWYGMDPTQCMVDRVEDHNFAVDLLLHKGYSRIYFDTTWHNPASDVRDGCYGCRVRGVSCATGEWEWLVRFPSFRGREADCEKAEDRRVRAAAVREAVQRLKRTTRCLEGDALLGASLRCEALAEFILPCFDK